MDALRETVRVQTPAHIDPEIEFLIDRLIDVAGEAGCAAEYGTEKEDRAMTVAIDGARLSLLEGLCRVIPAKATPTGLRVTA